MSRPLLLIHRKDTSMNKGTLLLAVVVLTTFLSMLGGGFIDGH
jgi:hypothetical protein